MKCANAKCKNEFYEDEGFEMGTSSGYGDDYIFCKKCEPFASKHFDIANYHDGGQMMAPSCEGREDVEPNIPHTCPFSKAELEETKLAFKNYRYGNYYPEDFH